MTSVPVDEPTVMSATSPDDTTYARHRPADADAA
jgi:hypothetical protein